MTVRLTPYELAFSHGPFEDESFAAIREEAALRSVDTASVERFLMLGTVGDLLRQMRPEKADVADVPDASLPPPDAVRDYGAVLFQAYRFRDCGCRLLTIQTPLLRELLSGDSIGDWTFQAPHPAGYLQMPRHLVWARIDEDAPAEAVDGFFWSVTAPAPGLPGRIDTLLVLGMHPARPGFSVIEAAAPLPAPPPGHWGDAAAREAGPDFANILPGGELRDLLAVTSGTEALKLVSRIFHYIAETPDSLRPAASTEQDEPGSSHAFPPSALQASEITIPD